MDHRSAGGGRGEVGCTYILTTHRRKHLAKHFFFMNEQFSHLLCFMIIRLKKQPICDFFFVKLGSYKRATLKKNLGSGSSKDLRFMLRNDSPWNIWSISFITIYQWSKTCDYLEFQTDSWNMSMWFLPCASTFWSDSMPNIFQKCVFFNL